MSTELKEMLDSTVCRHCKKTRGEHYYRSPGNYFCHQDTDAQTFEPVDYVPPNRNIIPGGTGTNSAWMFKTADGYEAGNEAQEKGSGTSIFDPVLCELAYRWFCPPGGEILDPFAGGSVRGIVASKLGRKYTGVDLSGVQIDANEKQAAQICAEPLPRWIVGDSTEITALAAGFYDFVWSCPPYGDLEQYSDDPRDLSAQGWEDFLTNYRNIIAQSCAMLKDDRFAGFVVGDIRDKDGHYRCLPEETVRAFRDCGLEKYNECILVTAVGSLGIRVGKMFGDYRKLGKTHQNVLIFVKGDWRKAAEAVGPVDIAADPTDFGERVEMVSGANLREPAPDYLTGNSTASWTFGAEESERLISLLPPASAETIREGLADGSLVMRPTFDGGRVVSVDVCSDDGTPMISGAEIAELIKKGPDEHQSHTGYPPPELGGPMLPVKYIDDDISGMDKTKPKLGGGLGGEI
jgi:hypothetical protein